MAYGVTIDGFAIKRFEDIRAELVTAFRSVYGAGINTEPDGVIGQKIDNISLQIAEVWEALQDSYDASDPAMAEGVALDALLRLSGLERQSAEPSTVVQTLIGANATAVPAETLFSSNNDQWRTLALATIATSTRRDSLVIAEVATNGTASVTINGEVYYTTMIVGDTDTSILERLALLVQANATTDTFAYTVGSTLYMILIDPTDTLTVTRTVQVQYSAGIYAGATQLVYVLGDVASIFTTGKQFTISAGANAGTYSVLAPGSSFNGTHTVIPTSGLVATETPRTITRTLDSTLAAANTYTTTVACESVEDGAIVGSQFGIQTIVTPVPSLAYVYNAAAATIGRDVEANEDARVRRDESVANVGSSNVDAIYAALGNVDGVTARNVYENDTNIVDAFGQPANSIQAVVSGGTDAAIASAIYTRKSAGITTYGNTGPIVATDSQGIDHDMYFTRPVAVPIYLVYNITLDAEQGDFPITGDATIKALAVAFGLANFGIGKNIAPWKLIGSIASVTGIGEVELLLQRDAPPGPGDTGAIPIDRDEVPEFEIVNVDVNHV